MADGPHETAALLDWLASRDAACPVCGYNLRGVPVPTCPECAAPIRLQVASPNVAVGPMLLAALSLGLAIGFDGITGLIFIGGFIFDPPPAGISIVMLPIIATLVALALACGTGLALLARRRRQVWRLPLARQWRLAWGLFVMVGAVHAAFGVWALHRLQIL